jgi:hypothetical protein
MKQIYQQLWELAKPYYEQGRPMDIDHITWMMEEALKVCEKEDIDDSLLMPLVILHDVGYSQVPKDNPTKINLRKDHMKAGAIIAKEILEKVNYPKEKSEKICYYVSVHDNWALNDNSVFKDPILAVFNDFDFMFTMTPKGFEPVKKILNMTSKELIEWAENEEKHIKRPFKTETTRLLFEKYIKNRRSEL